uniref:Uncharacterized protein n=1 Tax=Arion vulgaris TaxID=1028688 RepID=A0A0B7AVZ1_9EUPU
MPIGINFNMYQTRYRIQARKSSACEGRSSGVHFENDEVICTDGSVIRHMQLSWAFTAQVRGDVVKENSDILL